MLHGDDARNVCRIVSTRYYGNTRETGLLWPVVLYRNVGLFSGFAFSPALQRRKATVLAYLESQVSHAAAQEFQHIGSMMAADHVGSVSPQHNRHRSMLDYRIRTIQKIVDNQNMGRISE